MEVLEAHHFRLPACRFILDLFDKRVLRQIILEEEEEEEEESDSSKSDSETEHASMNDGSKPCP
jgi:rapamycin-insensitive companion of mTOR